jgi:hypothetical protein
MSGRTKVTKNNYNYLNLIPVKVCSKNCRKAEEKC